MTRQGPNEKEPEMIEDTTPDTTTDDEEDVPTFDECHGHEYLVDPKSLRPSEAVRLVTMFDTADAKAVVSVMEMIEDKYVKDPNGYQRFFREEGIEGVMTLVASFVGEFAPASR